MSEGVLFILRIIFFTWVIEMPEKKIRVALAGNPNVGKSTLFNALTGAHQHIGNWPGKTVELAFGNIMYRDYEIEFIDLPGTYSLSGFSDEEVVAREFIIKEKPDVVVVVTASTALPRNLYLLLQVMELAEKVVLVINKIDMIKKEGYVIDIAGLSKELQIEVVPTNAVMKEGIEELVKSIIKTYEKNIVHKEYRYPEPLESYILTLARKIGKEIDGYDSRWLAIRILERDSEITNLVKQKIPEIIDEAERIHNEIHKTMRQDPPLAIISARYETVDTLISKYVRRVTLKHQVSETLDKIVLHPVLQFVVTGLVFILLFWVTFYIGGFFQDAIGSIFEIITSSTEEYLKSQNASSLLVSFITSDSGILGALDAVAEFFPVILLFYFTFSVIENSGLLARLAFSIDKILSRIGMSGKVFFPITLSLGCTVVGMQATKIIEDRKFKFLLLLLISYVPCSARIGVLSVVLLILFHDAFIASTILFAIILGAFFLVGIEGKLLMKLTKNKPTPLIIELPPYSLPPLSMVLRMSWIRTKIFLSKAGTAIFGGILIVWILSNIPPNVPLNQTVIGQIGIALSVVFTPFGFDWRATVALLFGIFAKENTLAVLQGLYGGVSNVSTAFTLPQAIAFMVFYTYYIPCIASIAALKKETNSNSWVALTIIVNLLTAYLVAYLVFLLSSLVLAV